MQPIEYWLVGELSMVFSMVQIMYGTCQYSVGSQETIFSSDDPIVVCVKTAFYLQGIDDGLNEIGALEAIVPVLYSLVFVSIDVLYFCVCSVG